MKNTGLKKGGGLKKFLINIYGIYQIICKSLRETPQYINYIFDIFVASPYLYSDY